MVNTIPQTVGINSARRLPIILAKLVFGIFGTVILPVDRHVALE